MTIAFFPRSILATLALATLAALPACSSSDSDGTASGPGDTGEKPFSDRDCDPLVPSYCGYPFPTSKWQIDDATTKTGKRLHFGPKTLPYHSHYPTDPAPWNKLDGYSTGQTLL